jgi:hypothetical protein
MRGKTPGHKQIVEESIDLLNDLGIDISKAIKLCWVCRKEFKSSLPVRAHLTADKYGGNRCILLCNDCHNAQPDAAEISYQIQWIKKYKPSTQTETRKIIADWFEQMTNVPLDHLLNLMIDQWGTQGMLDRFRVALETGNQSKAGPKNGMANAVYELTQIYSQLAPS